MFSDKSHSITIVDTWKKSSNFSPIQLNYSNISGIYSMHNSTSIPYTVICLVIQICNSQYFAKSISTVHSSSPFNSNFVPHIGSYFSTNWFRVRSADEQTGQVFYKVYLN